MEYRANFLWGFDDNSIESLGYEFANAKTEEYQKECWEALKQAIKISCNPVLSDSENFHCSECNGIDGHKKTCSEFIR